MRKYELWLDETGDFSAKEQIKGSHNDKVYSLIGGVLIPADTMSNDQAAKLVGNEVGHATELDKKMIQDNLVPAIKTMKEKGAEFVFFENRQRITAFDDKVGLYMEMMVEGILQLISFLSTFEKEFQLDILIAVRYVSYEEGVLSMIPMEDYYEKLKETLMERLRYGYMNLDDDVKVNILFSSARKEPKLMLADYTCGARRAYLRKYDDRYTKEDKEVLAELFDENYVFDCYEYPLMGMIKNKLADNKLAEAILLLCDDKNLMKEFSEDYMERNGELLKNKIKWMIFEKMSQLGKLEVHCQIKELLGDLNASIQMEDEYEWGEMCLKKLSEEFLDELKKYEEYDEKLDLEISLSYAYLYLREGDFLNLEKELDRTEKLFGKLPQSMDFIWYKVNIWTLRQALALYVHDMEESKKWENKIKYYMDNLTDLLVLAGIWNDDEVSITVLQEESRRLKELSVYEEWLHGAGDIREAADYMDDAGEILEKQTLERARIFPRGCYYYEIGEGNFLKAFSWLTRFVGVKSDVTGLGQIATMKQSAEEFCRVLAEMDGKQKIDLIKEYLYLMVSMKKYELAHGSGLSYSSVLNQAMEGASLLECMEKNTKGSEVVTPVHKMSKGSPYRHLVRSVLDDFQERSYYPAHQVWWYMAMYLQLCGNDGTKMNDYYNKALLICEQSKEYEIMQAGRLMIQAERSGSKLATGIKRAQKELEKIVTVYKEVVESSVLTKSCKQYIEENWKEVLSMIEKGENEKKIGRELVRISHQMAL